jgi:membrane-bound serine protease (ClpP class)
MWTHWTLIGIICLIIAGLLLLPVFHWLIIYEVNEQTTEALIIITVTLIIIFIFLAYKAATANLSKVKTGKEALIGAKGTAITDLKPKGEIRVIGEIWQATAKDKSIKKDEEVEVIGLEGLFLIVKPAKEKTLNA